MATYSIRRSPMNGELKSHGLLRLWRVDETKSSGKKSIDYLPLDSYNSFVVQ